MTACLGFGLGLEDIPTNAEDRLAQQDTPVAEFGVDLSSGLCVVVNDPNLEIALPIARNTECLVYVQLSDAEAVNGARRKADSEGLYGRRLFIEKGDASHLYMADNLADVLIASQENEGTTPVSEAEALRVLRPQGIAFLGDRQLKKPFPDGIDDWSHPYHGPDNNPQSNDRVAKAPYLTQFLAEPYYAPLPQVATASAGRIFKAFGHLAFKSREEPLLNTLAAYNGYNGTLLWKRPLTPGIMVHRNTMIATPEILYLGDDTSCKLIDTATGELLSEIIPPQEIAGGTFWKWMALEDGVLYALIGSDEPRDPVIRQKRTAHGWPWDPLSPGFNQPSNPWGFGENLLAIDLQTKEVLWHYHEDTPIDSRSLCMKGGRLFFFRFGQYLGCLDTGTGKPRWRKTPKNDPELFEAIGNDLNRQDWRTNWRTTAYFKCNNDALYIAGPMFDKLLALSASDGSILWQNGYNNYQIVLRNDGLYAISGELDKNASRKFDPVTGEKLGDLPTARRACTRPTGGVDAIFFRALGGSVRLDAQTGLPQWISPMRAQCHDGVTIANGLLYWWPSVCDCQLSLYGMTCLGPAGDFDFAAEASDADRLERNPESPAEIADVPVDAADWPTFRANNRGHATSSATIPTDSQIRWQWEPESEFLPTAPIAVGDLIFVAGSDGVVRGLDAETGHQQWSAFTGGAIQMAPTFWNGRLLVGSGDGWIYALEARTGRQLWRFRAAPAERKIPVYGKLLSTWPVASGVLVENGIAYCAAGIANYDGTYVYALDAESGSIRWQNTTSGHLEPAARTGVSVQGHLLLDDGKLYLAGGTSLSPAIYDISDGKCLNDPSQLKECASIYPRGWELSLFGDHVFACGQPMYKDPEHLVYDPSAIQKIFHTPIGNRDFFWAFLPGSQLITCCRQINREQLNQSVAKRQRGFMIPTWGELKFREKPLWRLNCPNSRAVAFCQNGVVVASDTSITMVDQNDGAIRWEHRLPENPVGWGLAIDRKGQSVVAMKNGRIACIGARD